LAGALFFLVPVLNHQSYTKKENHRNNHPTPRKPSHGNCRGAKQSPSDISKERKLKIILALALGGLNPQHEKAAQNSQYADPLHQSLIADGSTLNQTRIRSNALPLEVYSFI